MIPRDLPDTRFREQIGPAVAHIADENILAPNDGGHQCGTHTLHGGFFLPPAANSVIGCRNGKAGNLLQLAHSHVASEIFLHLPSVGLHRQLAGHCPTGRSAHTIADHRCGVFADQHRLIGVLIFMAHKTNVRYAPDSHGSPAPSFSSIALRRSWPQDASISPPKLRRTVAVTPWDSNRF